MIMLVQKLPPIRYGPVQCVIAEVSTWSFKDLHWFHTVLIFTHDLLHHTHNLDFRRTQLVA